MTTLNIKAIQTKMRRKGWNQARFALELKLKAVEQKIPTPNTGFANYVYKIMVGDFVPKMDRLLLISDTLDIPVKGLISKRRREL